jgi:hypothetical protein
VSYFGHFAKLTSSIVDDLEKAVKAPGFKHPDFWKREFERSLRE